MNALRCIRSTNSVFTFFGVDGDKIAIAFASENGGNPSPTRIISAHILPAAKMNIFAVIIEFADDGQYFVKD
ncbi:MAG: hypothetical protein L6V93_14775 [Clostridiales bacterium]|nr:MAG: hypothetical protein L6V93_14775 [Clostridiales bacterium]